MRMVFSDACTRAAAIVALAVLAGCVTNSGTTGPAVGAAPSSAPSSSSTFVPRPPRAGYGVAYIGRPADFHATYMPVPIELDGQPLADIGRGRYVRVELAPGPHVVSAPDNYWSRTINGKPHPAHLTVEPGKTYYLLPKRWWGETVTTIHVVGRSVVPSQGALMQSSFTVQAGGPPPKEFTEMTPND